MIDFSDDIHLHADNFLFGVDLGDSLKRSSIVKGKV